MRRWPSGPTSRARRTTRSNWCPPPRPPSRPDRRPERSTDMHLGVLESNLSGSGFEGLRLAKERGHHVTFFTRDLQRYLDVPGAASCFHDYVDDIVFCETNDFDSLVQQVEDVAAR